MRTLSRALVAVTVESEFDSAVATPRFVGASVKTNAATASTSTLIQNHFIRFPCLPASRCLPA